MIKFIRIIIVLLLSFSVIFSQEVSWEKTVTLEVYPSTKPVGDLILEVDGILVGPLPAIITNLPTGEHNFTLKWEDYDGNWHSRSEVVNIKESKTRIYLSLKEEKASLSKPFLIGMGVSGGVFLTIGIIMVASAPSDCD